MATVIGDLCAPTGKYIKDGEEKTSWAKCGILMETDKGFRVKLDTVPVGGEGQGVWFSVFKRDEHRGQGSGGNAPQRQPAPSQGGSGDQDDIPF